MKSLSLLIKPASGNCQLRCRYCFYENVSESRETSNYGLMTLDTLDLLVKKAIAETTDHCTLPSRVVNRPWSDWTSTAI